MRVTAGARILPVRSLWLCFQAACGVVVLHTHPLIPIARWKAASPREEWGPEAVCEPRLPSPLPGVPLGCCSPKVAPCRVLFSCREVPIPSSACGGGTTLANDHGMTSPPCSASSSLAEWVAPLTQVSSTKSDF